MSATATAAAPVRRIPKLLWVVGVLSLLWNAMGCFDYLMTQTRAEFYMSQFSQEQLDFYYGFPAWVEAAWATAVWGSLAGSVLLLLRLRIAVWFFLISLVAMVVTTIHNYVLSSGLEIAGGAGPIIFAAVIFLVGVALLLYSRSLAARGILR